MSHVRTLAWLHGLGHQARSSMLMPSRTDMRQCLQLHLAAKHYALMPTQACF